MVLAVHRQTTSSSRSPSSLQRCRRRCFFSCCRRRWSHKPLPLSGLGLCLRGLHDYRASSAGTASEAERGSSPPPSSSTSAHQPRTKPRSGPSSPKMRPCRTYLSGVGIRKTTSTRGYRMSTWRSKMHARVAARCIGRSWGTETNSSASDGSSTSHG